MTDYELYQEIRVLFPRTTDARIMRALRRYAPESLIFPEDVDLSGVPSEHQGLAEQVRDLGLVVAKRSNPMPDDPPDGFGVWEKSP